MNSLDAYRKYGDPYKERNMTLFVTPPELAIDAFPKRIYMNKDLVVPLTTAFHKLLESCCYEEIKTWDGCFNLRPVRGYERKFKQLYKCGNMEAAVRYLSMHSWGLAVDINAAWNPLGGKSTFSKEFIRCFTTSGFDWGGYWNRTDPMHFQLSNF